MHVCPVVVHQANIASRPPRPTMRIRDQQPQPPVHVRSRLSPEELLTGPRGGRQGFEGGQAAYLPLQGLQLDHGRLVHMDVSHSDPARRVDHDTTNRQRFRLPKHRVTKQDGPRDGEQLPTLHVFVNLPDRLGFILTVGQAHQATRDSQTISNPSKHVIYLHLAAINDRGNLRLINSHEYGQLALSHTTIPQEPKKSADIPRRKRRPRRRSHILDVHRYSLQRGQLTGY